MFAIKTILVLWRAIREPLYNELSAREQNVLKWACLLHNISKRGSPLIMGRDHCQAFRSATTALKVFEQLGILVKGEPSEPKHQDWLQVIRLF